jgi:magnesium transporter
VTLVRRLADHFLEEHPDRAAAALERWAPAEIARAVDRGSAAHAGALLRRLSPQRAKATLMALEPKRGAQLLEAMEVGVAARLLRRLEHTRQTILLEAMDRRARPLRSLLRFPEDSAGAWMDPEVLALHQDATAREALAQVRRSASLARYNLYVIDREQRLVGVLNLRELLLARPREPLSDRMVRDPDRLLAAADRSEILAHPGWQKVSSLPVVDDAGGYLGAIRYRTLRELEAQLLSRGRDDDASAALSRLFLAGAGAFVEALTGAVGEGPTHRA